MWLTSRSADRSVASTLPLRQQHDSRHPTPGMARPVRGWPRFQGEHRGSTDCVRRACGPARGGSCSSWRRRSVCGPRTLVVKRSIREGGVNRSTSVGDAPRRALATDSCPRGDRHRHRWCPPGGGRPDAGVAADRRVTVLGDQTPRHRGAAQRPTRPAIDTARAQVGRAGADRAPGWRIGGSPESAPCRPRRSAGCDSTTVATLTESHSSTPACALAGTTGCDP